MRIDHHIFYLDQNSEELDGAHHVGRESTVQEVEGAAGDGETVEIYKGSAYETALF